MTDTTDRQYECYACAEKDAEIERLTALRKEDGEDMQRLLDQVDYLSDENDKLQAQVERNKAYLARIAKLEDDDDSL